MFIPHDSTDILQSDTTLHIDARYFNTPRALDACLEFRKLKPPLCIGKLRRAPIPLALSAVTSYMSIERSHACPQVAQGTECIYTLFHTAPDAHLEQWLARSPPVLPGQREGRGSNPLMGDGFFLPFVDIYIYKLYIYISSSACFYCQPFRDCFQM